MNKKNWSVGIILLSVFTQTVFSFSFSVDQSSIHVSTARGKTQTMKIRLRNDNEQAITVSAYAMDWMYLDNGAKKFLPLGVGAASCGTWLRFPEKQVSIPALGAKDVSVEIQTPQTATGGHQAVVFFESEVPAVATSDAVLQYSARIGVLVYQETEGATNYAVEVAEAKASKVGDKIYYRVLLRNAGNAWNNAVLNLSVLNNDDVVKQIQQGPVQFLPQGQSKLEGSFEGVQDASQMVYVVEDYQRHLLTGGFTFTTENIASMQPTAAVQDTVPTQTEITTGSSTVSETITEMSMPTPSVAGVELLEYSVKFQEKTRDLKVYVKLKSTAPRTAKAFVAVVNSNGQRVKTVALNQRQVLPGKPAQMVVLWPIYQDLPSGEYTCALSVLVDGQTMTQNKTVRW